MATTEPPEWHKKYCFDNLAYGPLPHGIDVVSNGDAPVYKIKVGSEMRQLTNHPLSPSGRHEWRDLLGLAGEEQGTKSNTLGVTHPPITYKPSEWTWDACANLENVLLCALKITGADITTATFTEPNHVKAVNELMADTTRKDLYHPCDRAKLSPFPEEHKASCWARHFNTDLVVFGPEVSKDRSNVFGHFLTLSSRRTAVRARYSTGEQGSSIFIVIGCLPISKVASTWFLMRPTQVFRDRLNQVNKMYNWSDQATRFGHVKGVTLALAVVAVQRSIMLGVLTVTDDDLSECVSQYGKYIEDRKRYGKTAFIFQRSTNATPSELNFNDITYLILYSTEDSITKRYARAWDNAIRLYLAFKRSLESSDWAKFAHAAAALYIKT